MKVALVPFDPEVGDVQGNAARMAEAVRDAAGRGADLVVLPELALCGYPPRDVLLRAGFVEACEAAAARLASVAPGATVVVGSPRGVRGGPRPIANSVAVLRGGRVLAWYDKRLLPTYDVFDEHRYFTPGAAPGLVAGACPGDRPLGVMVCEDLWRARDVNARAEYAPDPVGDMAGAGAACIAVPSASPFERGKHARHVEILRSAAARAGAPLLSVNQGGACDDLVFDGDVRVVWPDGRMVAGPRWGSEPLVVDLADAAQDAARSARAPAPANDDTWRDLWHALVRGTRAYLARTGHARAVLGLSGGVDSALVAAVGAAAIGGRNVTGVLMPGRWSSPGSVADALESARRLRMPTLSLPIGAAHDLLAASVGDGLRSAALPPLEGLADENLQSRLRGLQVMAVSNATGALALTTGNKSEYAVGYTTLYGDMNGGLAPIGDVLKTDVYALSRWVNAHAAACGFGEPPIPEASLAKAPSAELRADQTDQDTLPPYEHLDAIIRGWVEEERSEEEIVRATGLAPDLVRTWTRAIDRAEFKRFQAALILKVSSRAFGRGRRMPLALRWRPS
jgi:NAD+ synthase/NAD+ synthase (glutamine-hydrolysing)